MHFKHALLPAILLLAISAKAQFTLRLGIYPTPVEKTYFTEKGWPYAIQELKHENGYFHYHSGQFKTWTEAEVVKAKAKRLAWDGAEVIDLEELEVMRNHPCPYVLENDSNALNTFYLPFEGRSISLSSQVKTTLRSIADILKEYPDVVVKITGHTDNEGEAPANRVVSGNRAREVRDYLRSVHGIPATRIFTAEAGESAPLLPNSDEYQCALRQNQWINNRVTVTLKLAMK